MTPDDIALIFIFAGAGLFILIGDIVLEKLEIGGFND